MRRYITITAGLLLAAAASAQNLNPTVQVTNVYEGKLMEVEKQTVPMALPDSLMQFDWNFNYSVFDNPYKGAYEFNPYFIEVKPDPVPYDGHKLYLRAGAGYSFHPELQAVWSPDIKGRFGLTVYDDFKGYWGHYHNMDADMPSYTSQDVTLQSVGKYDGFDAGNRFGATLRYDASKVILSLDGKFDWLNTLGWNEGYNNAFGESFVLEARSNVPSAFSYDVRARFNGLNNTADWLTPLADIIYPDGGARSYRNHVKFNENIIGGDFSFGYNIAEGISLLLDGRYDNIRFNASETSSVANWLDISPSVTFSGDRASALIGFKYSDVWKKPLPEEVFPPLADYDGWKIYPRISASYEILEEALVLSAGLTGGQKYNTYAGYLESEHYFQGLWSSQYYSLLGDASENTVSADLGLSGRIRSRFQFNLEAGYDRFKNSPLEGLTYNYLRNWAPVRNTLLNYTMENYDLLHASLTTWLRSDRIDASSLFKVQKMTKLAEDSQAFTLPAFVGSVAFTYNWNRRIFAGVSAEWATGRSGSVSYVEPLSSSALYPYDQYICKAPGWVDLGVNLEFKVNSKFSLWLKGSNLLNQKVMRDFMIVEAGPSGIIGIGLVL